MCFMTFANSEVFKMLFYIHAMGQYFNCTLFSKPIQINFVSLKLLPCYYFTASTLLGKYIISTAMLLLCAKLLFINKNNQPNLEKDTVASISSVLLI